MKIKLAVEMIPQSQHGSKLKSLLTADEWDECKRMVARRSNSCEICNGVGNQHAIECHEVWGYDYDFDVYAAVMEIVKQKFLHYIKGSTGQPLKLLDKNYSYPILFKDITVGQWNNMSHERQFEYVDANISRVRKSRIATLYSMLNAPNRSSGQQTLKGLIALCPACHMAKHYEYAQINGKANVAEYQLKRVNGWHQEQLLNYLNYKVAQRDARNFTDWTLNVDWLFRHVRLSENTRKKLNFMGVQKLAHPK